MVLSELYDYTVQNPQPADVESVRATLKYLEACNKMFEKGLLSHEKVCTIDSKVMQSIQEGYSFFVNWHESLSKHGKCLYVLALCNTRLCMPSLAQWNLSKIITLGPNFLVMDRWLLLD